MSIADTYSSWAAAYDSDRNLTRDLDAEVTRRLIGVHRRPVVVEAGCGTGKNTRFFAEIADEVHALDFSEGMLSIARSRVTAPHVRFEQADLSAAWPVAPGRAHLVSFNLVLEHFEMLAPVLSRSVAALTPDGTLFISELHPFKQYQGSQPRFVNPSGQEVRLPSFTHHVSDFLSAASENGLVLSRLDEWWHAEDPTDGGPRLITFVFRRHGGGAQQNA